MDDEILALLADLRDKNVSLSSDGGELRFRAPKGALTMQELDTLRALKPRILEALRAETAREGRSRSRTDLVGNAGHPLLFMPQVIWAIAQTGSLLRSEENLCIPLSAHGRLSQATVESALAALLARHEALRMKILIRDGQPYVKYEDAATCPLEVKDVSSQIGVSKADIVELASNFAWRRFTLIDAPLLRCLLMRVSEDHHVLVLVIHHVAGDAWSTHLVRRELIELCTALSSNRIPALPTPVPAYSEYVQRQLTFIESPAGRACLHDIALYLAKASPLDLSHVPAAATAEPDDGTMVLWDKLFVERLQQHCRSLRISNYVLLLAAHVLLLWRWTRNSNIVLRNSISNRHRPDRVNLVGCVVEGLPFHVELTPARTIQDLVGLVQSRWNDTLAGNLIPLTCILERFGDNPALRTAPHFNVVDFQEFAFKTASGELAWETVDLHEAPRTQGIVRPPNLYDFTVISLPNGLLLRHKWSVFPSQVFLQEYRETIELAMTNPASTLAEVVKTTWQRD